MPDALRGWRHDGKCALVEDVLIFLLYNQFVKTTTDKDRLWRVTQRSGMGLVHSSDFMDYVFHNKVEDGLLPFLHEYCVKRYFRYRDDVLIRVSAHARPLARAFVRKLFDWSGYFKLKVEEVSSIELGNFSMNY